MVLRDGAEAKSLRASGEISDAAYQANVNKLCAAFFLSVTAQAISLGPLYDAYLLNVGGNMLVGGMQSTLGMVQLCLAFPLGLLADRISRLQLVRCVLPAWTVGLCAIVAGVVLDRVLLIVAGVICWSPCFQGFTNTAQVLVADWSPTSRRTEAVSNFTTTGYVATAIGPFLQVVLLLGLGRQGWEDSLLHPAIAFGLVVWPGVWCATCSLSDLPAFEKTQRGRSAPGAFRAEDLDRRLLGVRLRWWVAVNLELVALVSSVGAGMTLKFFPLFFMVDYGFTPVQVCVLSVASPLCTAGMVQVCAKASPALGRLNTIVVFHFLATACLWSMVYIKPLGLILPVFFARGALMNARGPIVRSVVMDLVPSDTRGCWNSIQSLASFSWAGSAALGGYVADKLGGYRAVFAVTATIYTVSFALSLPMFAIYPPEVAAVPKAPGAEDALRVKLLEASKQNQRTSSVVDTKEVSTCPDSVAHVTLLEESQRSNA